MIIVIIFRLLTAQEHCPNSLRQQTSTFLRRQISSMPDPEQYICQLEIPSELKPALNYKTYIAERTEDFNRKLALI